MTRVIEFIDVLGGISGDLGAVAVSAPFMCAVCKVFAFPDRHFMF
jgi:hypothetical protein